MKIFKFILLVALVTILMLFSWTVGSAVGNWLTQTNPPVVAHPELVVVYFLAVCLFNSFLIAGLVRMTRLYSGGKTMLLTGYVFVVQFFLTQLETLFFFRSIGISIGQVMSILIAGLVMSSITVPAGVRISQSLFRQKDNGEIAFTLPPYSWRKALWPIVFLAAIVYPLLYMLFGYYVAWQHEELRVFYSGSAAINSFPAQLMESVANGIYVYQVFRGLIWIMVTAPVVIMLRPWGIGQYISVALLSAFLPASLLFIPNPYMPEQIAMIHFIETASSNFFWGLAITMVLNRYLHPTLDSEKFLKYSGH